MIVQTNGALIDSAWAALFREHDISVGVSLDGPRERHDASRVRSDGSGSYEQVLRGIAALRAAEVPVAAIAVVDAQHASYDGAAEAMVEHFRTIGLPQFDVHPAYSLGTSDITRNVSAASFAHFFVALFEAWLATGDTAVEIGFFEQFFQSMTGRLAAACYLSGRCTTILGVGPDGSVMPCTRPFPEHPLGNLAASTLESVAAADPFTRFAQLERAGRERTSACAWRELCHGGCPHERERDGAQAVDGRHVYCTCEDTSAGYPAVFSHMRRRAESLLADHC
jgi:uncharacterized protein